jgi:hypothetical protein
VEFGSQGRVVAVLFPVKESFIWPMRLFAVDDVFDIVGRLRSAQLGIVNTQ